MATKNFYLAADGTAGGAATSWATRTTSRTQLYSVILANTVAGDDVIIWCSGLICRETHSSWAAINSLYWLDFDTTKMVGRSLRIASAANEPGAADPSAPVPQFVDFYLYGSSTADWTDTGTTTTRGTKIWKTANWATGAHNGVGRVWGANYKTDATFATKEIWEGGNNYSATLGAAIHQNLDVIAGDDAIGGCYTLYDATGTRGVSPNAFVFLACAVNPYTAFGTMTFAMRGINSSLLTTAIPGLVIDPEVEFWGGGVRCLNIVGGAANTIPSVIECKILYGNPYQVPMRFTLATSNVYVSPYVDTGYTRRLPYYHAEGTAHQVSANEIIIDNTCDMSAATGWPEQGRIPGIIVQGTASNGRVSRIRDLFHTGITTRSPSVAGTHKFIRIEDGITFDFANAQYGTAIGGLKCELVQVKNVKVRVAPSACMAVVGAANMRYRVMGGTYETAKNTGDRSAIGNPWGDGENKNGTSIGFGVSTQSGYATGEIIVEDATFCCQDGGFLAEAVDSTAMSGKVRVLNCVFIRSHLDANQGYPVSSADGLAIDIQGYGPETMDDFIEFINCVAVGFGPLPVKHANKPGSASALALDAIPVGVNVGWTLFDTLEEFKQAKSSGQLPHIVA